MARPDPYTLVHKMQRARLFDLIAAAGRVDGSDSSERSALAGATIAMAAEIRAHGQHEDRFVHPLLRRCVPDIADALEEAHEDLDAQLEELASRARAFASSGATDPNDLYRSLAAFAAGYLAHIDVEETEALTALRRHCSDDDVLALLAAFRESRPATTNLASTLALVSTANPQEIEALLATGLGGATPSELADLLATLLPPGRFGELSRQP